MIIHRRRGSATAEAAELQPGDAIAGYRIERLLGAGGMGAVYEATQLSLKRRIALKVIAPGVPIDETLRGRFRREGELQAVIDHPHILPVYEAGDDRGRLFIAMRLVPGPTLKQLITTRSLDPTAALRLLGDIAGALDAAHAEGLVHRDVKPQNILIAPGDHAYLADFGLSRGRSDDTLTRAGQLLGSLSYIAPEQIRGERVGAPADVYSFTCVIYECLVGLVPFPRDSDAAVLHAHEWDDPPRPSALRPELPAALDDVIAAGMAKDPAARPAAASTLVDAARAAFGVEGPTHATIPLARDDEPSEDTLRRVPAPLPPAAKTRRVRSVLAAAAAAALLAGSAAGYLVTRDSDHAAKPPAPAKTADASFGMRLNTAFAQLDTSQARLRGELASAKTPRAQSAVLADIASSYADARTAVATSQPPAGARATGADVERALARLGATYRDMSRAAAHGDRRAYDRARVALGGRQRQLTSALEGLERAGYRLQ